MITKIPKILPQWRRDAEKNITANPKKFPLMGKMHFTHGVNGWAENGLRLLSRAILCED